MMNQDPSIRAMNGVVLDKLKILAARAIASDAVGALLRCTIARHECGYRGKRISIGTTRCLPHRVVSALWFGLYESAECRMVQRHMLPDRPVVELGAGIGALSAHVAGALSSGQHLTSVEGNSALVTLLRQNLDRHGRHLSVTVLNNVIGNGNGVDFSIAPDHRFSRVQSSIASTHTAVKSTRLSAIVAKRPFADGYQLVADIEGAEAAVLLEDHAAWPNCERAIMELHESEHLGEVLTVDRLVALVESRGLKLVARDGNVFAFSR
jgi:FkbM family methyltransferase